MIDSDDMRHSLIRFLRGPLGCGCPDEVLREIAWQPQQVAGERLLRIAVGGGLLVYLWPSDDPRRLEEVLPALLTAGRSERDREGFNRFRLAVATGDKVRLEPVAHRLFSRWPDRDAETYLHLVDRGHAVVFG